MFKVGDKVCEWDQVPIVEISSARTCIHVGAHDYSRYKRREILSRTLAEKKTGRHMKKHLKWLIEVFHDVFAFSEQELTQTSLTEHKIEIGAPALIRQSQHQYHMQHAWNCVES